VGLCNFKLASCAAFGSWSMEIVRSVDASKSYSQTDTQVTW